MRILVWIHFCFLKMIINMVKCCLWSLLWYLWNFWMLFWQCFANVVSVHHWRLTVHQTRNQSSLCCCVKICFGSLWPVVRSYNAQMIDSLHAWNATVELFLFNAANYMLGRLPPRYFTSWGIAMPAIVSEAFVYELFCALVK